MIYFLGRIVINSLLFMALSGYLSSFHVNGFWVALTASFVLALLNIIVRPILLVLTLPINFFTLGLFTFIINALMLELTSYFIGGQFKIDYFGTAILIAIVMMLVNMIVTSFVLDKRK